MKGQISVLALYQQIAETWPKGHYAAFIATKRAPELLSFMETTSKAKRGKS